MNYYELVNSFGWKAVWDVEERSRKYECLLNVLRWWILWVHVRSHLVYEFEEGDQFCGRGSKLLAGMKPPPAQLRLFWDEVDIGNEEIIGVATKFVKANCYSPNPKLF